MTPNERVALLRMRLYVLALVGLSLALMLPSLLGLFPHLLRRDQPFLLGMIGILLMLATARPIKLSPHVKLSLRIAPQLLAAALLPFDQAILVTGFGVLAGYLYLFSRHRANRTDLLFNTADGVLTTAIAGLLYHVALLVPLGPVGPSLALLLAAEGLHLSNTLLVASAMVLSGQQVGIATAFRQLITNHPLQYVTLLIIGMLGTLLARDALWSVPLLVVPLILLERTLLIERAELDRQRQQTAENARLYHEAQAALKQRDEFLRLAAHELKTPITNLSGYTQLLQRSPPHQQPPSVRDQRVLRTIADQGRRLHRMVIMLLDVSRLQNDRLLIDQHPVDLCILAQRIIEESQPTLEEHPVSFSCASGPVIISGDELRLEEVCFNLLQNAAKYSWSGGKVLVHVEQRGDQGCLIVRDHGIGIPSEALPHLFERFYQVPHGQAAPNSGFGIGLYIVNEIVTAHGGKVEVTSTEKGGSTFTVYLPCHVAEPQLQTQANGELSRAVGLP